MMYCCGWGEVLPLARGSGCVNVVGVGCWEGKLAGGEGAGGIRFASLVSLAIRND